MKPRNPMGIHVHRRVAGKHGRSFKAERNQENSKIAQVLAEKHESSSSANQDAWDKYQEFELAEAA